MATVPNKVPPRMPVGAKAVPIPPARQRAPATQLLKDIAVEEDQFRATVLDADDVQGEYTRVSGDMAYWVERYVRAFLVWKDAEVESKRVWGAEFMAAATLTNAAGKPYTKDDRDATADSHPNVVATKQAENAANAEQRRLWGVVDAIRKKGEMLVSLGATIRKEMDGMPSMREPEEGSMVPRRRAQAPGMTDDDIPF